MSTAHPDEAPGEDEVLQFDEAEFSAPAPAVHVPTCVNCQKPIPDAYFEINGKVVCGHCREGIEAAFHGGSGMARFMRASLFGLGAAIVGAVIYYIAMSSTGYHIGLIAILVGFMVGRAVYVGTGNRGGRVYQFLALVLTYSAIAGINAPSAVEEYLTNVVEQEVVPDPAVAGNEPGKAVDPANGVVAPAAPAQAERIGPRDAPAIIVFVVAIIECCYVYPIAEIMDDPIMAMIYGFGLWEAWRINKGVKLVINGPFRVGEGAHAG